MVWRYITLTDIKDSQRAWKLENNNRALKANWQWYINRPLKRENMSSWITERCLLVKVMAVCVCSVLSFTVHISLKTTNLSECMLERPIGFSFGHVHLSVCVLMIKWKFQQILRSHFTGAPHSIINHHVLSIYDFSFAFFHYYAQATFPVWLCICDVFILP